MNKMTEYYMTQGKIIEYMGYTMMNLTELESKTSEELMAMAKTWASKTTRA